MDFETQEGCSKKVAGDDFKKTIRKRKLKVDSSDSPLFEEKLKLDNNPIAVLPLVVENPINSSIYENNNSNKQPTNAPQPATAHQFELVKNEEPRLFNKFKFQKFDIPFYCKNCLNQDLVFILGYSNEGKSVVALLLLLNKLIANIKSNTKTRLLVFAGSDSAKDMISRLIDYICAKRADLKKTWNSKECLISVDFKTDFQSVVEEFKAVVASSLKNVEKIFYFDDVGTDLSNNDGDHRKLYDDLGSKARHFNITTIINSQKIVGISQVLTKQIKTFIVIGKITQADFKEMSSRLTCFYDFEEGTAKDFGQNWFSTVGFKCSRNGLVMSTSYCQKKSCDSYIIPLKLSLNFFDRFFKLLENLKKLQYL